MKKLSRSVDAAALKTKSKESLDAQSHSKLTTRSHWLSYAAQRKWIKNWGYANWDNV